MFNYSYIVLTLMFNIPPYPHSYSHSQGSVKKLRYVTLKKPRVCICTYTYNVDPHRGPCPSPLTILLSH